MTLDTKNVPKLPRRSVVIIDKESSSSNDLDKKNITLDLTEKSKKLPELQNQGVDKRGGIIYNFMSKNQPALVAKKKKPVEIVYDESSLSDKDGKIPTLENLKNNPAIVPSSDL